MRKRLMFLAYGLPWWLWWLTSAVVRISCWIAGHKIIDMGRGPFCAWCLKAAPAPGAADDPTGGAA